jgi:enoyl-CoA hydratase
MGAMPLAGAAGARGFVYGSAVADQPLHYALEGSTAVLRMDDGKANALSDAMIDALSEAIDRAAKEASAVVLLGRPDRFCAGFDLRVMMSGPEPAKALLRRGSALLMKLYGAPLPLVMGCTGHALAGGALVLLTGDVRVGATGPYRLGLNEVSIGMPVPVLAMELARDRLRVTDLGAATLQAKIYGPDEAARVGYLDEVVSQEELVPRAMAEATRLAALPRTAFAATKERLRGRTIAHILGTLEADMAKLLTPVG